MQVSLFPALAVNTVHMGVTSPSILVPLSLSFPLIFKTRHLFVAEDFH